MTNFTVIFDANVLYPNFLRDILMRLSPVGLFRGRWTADIHREWMEAVRMNRPDLDPGSLERTRQLMDAKLRSQTNFCLIYCIWTVASC